MSRLLWHIGIRIYNNVWLPIISWVMNRWYMWKHRKYIEMEADWLPECMDYDDEDITYNDDLKYIPDKFDWQSSPLVFLLRGGGDCEDWAVWWKAIYPGGRIYRLYNVALRRGHAVYLLGTVVYDQKIKRDLPEAANDKEALLKMYTRYEEVV